jgi:uncharacterized protein
VEILTKKRYICKPGKKSSVIINNISVEIQPKASLILGFAGVGLIGPIITNELIHQIEDFQEIGFITSEELPPISVFYEGILKHPFRLLYSPHHNILLGACELPFQSSSAYNDLARTICHWALSDDVNAEEIVIFQGILRRGVVDEFPVYYAGEEEIMEKLNKFGIEKVNKGLIIGPEATMLNEALMNRLNAYVLFTPVQEIPTPEGAAAILEVLNEIFHLSIDTNKLIEQGKEIKTKMLELAQKANQYQQNQLKGSNDNPAYYK